MQRGRYSLFFFKSFWVTHMSFLGPLVPLFWISGGVSSGVHSQSRFSLIRFFAEANVMYIPWDPPLVLHVLTSWWPACCQSPHTVAEVRLPGFELVLSEHMWVRRSSNWAKRGRYSYVTSGSLYNRYLEVLIESLIIAWPSIPKKNCHILVQNSM